MFRILVVCTANICRSPASATLLRRELAPLIADGAVSVESAGTAAADGSPACDLSSALVGEFVARHYPGRPALDVAEGAHRARRVRPAMIADADLVLALDRSHRAELARLDAAARPRTFSLRQAAGLSQLIRGYMDRQEMPPGAPPVPPDIEARLRWWVSELDAMRGLLPGTGSDSAGERTGALMQWHPDDVPDPHVMGYQIHGAAIELAEEAILTISSCVAQVVAYGSDAAATSRP